MLKASWADPEFFLGGVRKITLFAGGGGVFAIILLSKFNKFSFSISPRSAHARFTA